MGFGVVTALAVFGFGLTFVVCSVYFYQSGTSVCFEDLCLPFFLYSFQVWCRKGVAPIGPKLMERAFKSSGPREGSWAASSFVVCVHVVVLVVVLC